MIAPSGFQVGPYVVRGPAGRGGMADVFVANDSRTAQRVALKLVPLGDDHDARQIVEAEREGAEYQKQLWQVYRQVPEVYEYGSDESYFYIAMEFLEGQNLSELISRGALTPERALDIAVQICRFLEAAHQLEPTIDGRKRRSLLHGDLKPRNIRILKDDEVKVFDFGAAKALSYSRKVTRHDFGSIAYLSPERIESGDIDAHADFWGVGVILYEMISGAQPFQAKDTRRLESMIRARRPPPMLNHGAPVGVQAVVAKLLAAAQHDRYGSAQEIREDLECARAGRETLAEREGWPARVQDEPATRRVRIPGNGDGADTGDDEATRRTSPSAPDTTIPPVVPIARGFGPPPKIGNAPQPPAPVKKRSRLARVFKAALLVVAFVIVVNEIRISGTAGRLADTVATQGLNELDTAWLQYRELRAGSLGIGASSLERALMRQTVTLTERVFANYRTPSPSVREAHWRAAREQLAYALGVRRDDENLRAALRYADGHLHRIDGEARKARKLAADAQREFADALVAFREAAELRPEWPDPYLGLMRTFIYGLDDVERGEDALGQAVNRGYKAGDRETIQLAEGHRVRADVLVRSGRQFTGSAQELQYLNRAVDEYRKALNFYSQVPAFGDTVRQMRITQRALASTEQRISAMTAAPAPVPVPASGDAPPTPAPPEPPVEASPEK
jgi:eukaryotic-like serine/threonine-protein kinase